MMNDYDGEDFQIDNENNTLYHTFKDFHPCWLFVGNAILKAIYVTPGIFMNIAVIFVTIRSKSSSIFNYHSFLHFQKSSKYGQLSSCPHLPLRSFPSAWTFFVHIYGPFRAHFLHYPLAVRICSLPIFGLIAVGPSLFFTGIDRLFAVTFLSFYQRVNLAIYLLSILAVCSAYSGYTLFLVYKNTNLLDNLQVTGNIGDLLQGEASQFYYKYTLILNSVTICIYIAVGIIIRFRSVDQTNKRIFRSLFAIISINIGGYYLMRIYTNFIVPNVLWSPITVWTVRQIFSIPLNLSAGSNCPILYLTSVEYKKAFREEFGIFINFLRRQKKDGTKVQPITNNTQIIRQIISGQNAHKRMEF